MLNPTALLRLLGPASDLTQGSKRTLHCISSAPRPIVRSLPFAPPPKWAASVPQRLDRLFPLLERKRNILFLKALVHPSYTTESAIDGTMASLAPIGQALLMHTFQCAVTNVSTSSGNFTLNPKHCAQDLASDGSLSAVVKGVWGLEDLILTDAVIREIHDARTSKGLLQMSGSRTTLPLAYHRLCAQAIVGAVFADNGMNEAMKFVCEHVLPHAVEYLALL